MLDQMLPSLLTLVLLVCLFLRALLIDFLIHLRKRSSPETRSPSMERRKTGPDTTWNGQRRA